MAKSLRNALAEHGHELSHGQCLDLVARQLGYADWNVLSARGLRQARPDLQMPEGWFAASHSSHELYCMGIAPDQTGVAMIASRAGAKIPKDHTGVLMQSFSAQSFRGKRLMLKAELKTLGATAGTLWMRIDPRGGGRYLRFDNMLRRTEDGALRGDTDWTERSVVLDVPYSAESIHLGFFLMEQGAVWARNFALDTVGDDVPETSGGQFPHGPTNFSLQ
ncbi:glyoxalase superfamily protein [Pelagibacterium sp.]|uniref:glyoxalase superfamily protein n=1 Tax=Pelagibacterium sp. TaxID=1967288 RepID=UPI003A8EB04E